MILGIWRTAEVIVLAAAAAGGYAALRGETPLDDYVMLWRRWDTNWFESIAQYGYVGPYVSEFQDFRYDVAFFPAVPVLTAVGSWIGLPPTLSGLVISPAASLAATFAVTRLVERVEGRAEWGAVALLAVPTHCPQGVAVRQRAPRPAG